MIDLHSHILPGIDDGAPDLETSISMAKLAVAGGTHILACTPHIMPPTYPNTVELIAERMRMLQAELDARQINLKLIMGADIHIVPDLIEGLKTGRLPTLNGSKYFLFEPSHRVLPPNIVPFSERIMAAGYVPVLTHPERLTWVETHYEVFKQLDRAGLVIQLTAGSLIGKFGGNIRDLSLQMMNENRVDIIASDAHNLGSRSPDLSKVYKFIRQEYGDERARLLLAENPAAMLRNQKVAPRKRVKLPPKKTSLMDRMRGLLR